MPIKKSISVSIDIENAFKTFIDDFNNWWPQEYTWSRDSLQEIGIGKEKGELCTEIGPDGFRCDWGRITEFVVNKMIKMKWQIGPNREPVPNPELASDIKVVFHKRRGSSTEMTIEHLNFKNHGEQADEYKAIMNSDQGWPYILNRFKNYCENKNE